MKTILRLCALALVFVFLSGLIPPLLDDSEARPGGGHSFSGGGGYSGGGGSSFGGSSSGGDGDPRIFAVILAFYLLYKALAVLLGKHRFKQARFNQWQARALLTPLITGGALLGFFAVGKGQLMAMMYLIVVGLMASPLYLENIKQRGSSRSTKADTAEARRKRAAAITRKTEALKQKDKNFSRVLLVDFVQALYVRLRSATKHSEQMQLTPFIAEKVFQGSDLRLDDDLQVMQVVVGVVRIIDIIQREDATRLQVEIEANYSVSHNNQYARYATQERWTLSREPGVLSAPPEKMRALNCPQCGAPAQFSDAGICPACGSLVQQGRQHWYVRDRVLVNRHTLAANSLVSYAEEAGTHLPTLFQAGLANNIKTFQQNHGISDWATWQNTFEHKIVRPVFMEMYAAWSELRWDDVRHLLSDRLHSANQFWIDMYRAQKWTNRLEKIEIRGVTLARIELDEFYEAITVRVSASCLDYTEDKQGKLLGGSKRRQRQFSEYWTFIRRNGVETQDDAFDPHRCPQCGAPADKMGQSAECGYCGAKISHGDFSWVLALIIQDEVYLGL
jgi:predicted lipid-binding transport protein (Tim44 family)